MTRISINGHLLLLIVLFIFGNVPANCQEVNFCAFSLPKGVLQANASFNAIYQFDVDKNGDPINIKPTAKEFTNPQDVQVCIRQWTLPQSANQHLVAVFEWRHGIGWTKLAVSGPGIKLTVHLSGQRCPYCTGETNNTMSTEPPTH
jgi:hypothetical protein